MIFKVIVNFFKIGIFIQRMPRVFANLGGGRPHDYRVYKTQTWAKENGAGSIEKSRVIRDDRKRLALVMQFLPKKEIPLGIFFSIVCLSTALCAEICLLPIGFINAQDNACCFIKVEASHETNKTTRHISAFECIV